MATWTTTPPLTLAGSHSEHAEERGPGPMAGDGAGTPAGGNLLGKEAWLYSTFQDNTECLCFTQKI